MPKLLSPEEFEAQFGGGRRAAAPQAGRGTLFGSGVDRAQAGLLEIGEAVGLPVGDWRREQQFESEESARRYYQTNPRAVQSFRDISGAGDAGSYIVDLAVQSAPALVGIGAAGLLAGPAGAFAAGSAFGTGEILQAQRQQAGTTDLGTAVPLGLVYGAADALTGLGGMVARRSLGTGIRALDDAGRAALNKMPGLGGAAARTAASFGRTGLAEAAGETFQDFTVNVGRLAVDPDVTLFGPKEMEGYLESAVGGFALGGVVGSGLGGWRRSADYQQPGPEQDLTSKPGAVAEKQQYGLVTEMTPLQQRINEQMGIGRKRQKDYVKQFEAAFNEPSGQYATDAQTGVERQLSVGELVQLQNPSMDLTQPSPAKTATANTLAVTAERDPRAQTLRDTYGVIPTPSAMALLADIEASGIPADSSLVSGVWAYAAEKPMTLKRLDKARLLLDQAIIESRKGATNVSAVPVPAAPAAGSVGVGGPVVQPSVGAAGLVSQLPGRGVAGTAATSATPSSQGGAVAPVGQPATTVTAETAAPAATTQVAPAAEADPREEVLKKIFGDRNGQIIFDVIGMGMPEPEAAAKYGLSRQSIQKIAGATGAETRAARVEKARAEGRVTQTEIDIAFRPAPAAQAGTIEQEVFGPRRNMFSIGAEGLSATEAEAEGLVDLEAGDVGVKTVGASKGAVEGFSKLEKDTMAVLEALAVATDPDVVAELNQKLTALTEKVRELETVAQEEVRRTAGKEPAPTVEGEEDAVQEQGAAEVPVQPEAEAGKGVGRQVRRAKKSPAKGEAAVPAKVLTPAEQAAQAWDVVAAEYPSAPKFADLTKEQREDFIDFGPENWTKADVETELTKLARGGEKFGKDARAKNPYTAKELLDDIKSFIRADIPGRKLLVVDTVNDLLTSSDKSLRVLGAAIALNNAYGVAKDGRAVLIADRIEKGRGRAKFMHEVGTHLGLKGLLPKAQFDKLTQQILNWAKKDDGSVEAELALNAVERVQAAGTVKEDQREELLAYFLEEAVQAGIDPTAAGKESSQLRDWFRTLWAAFKIAVRKLGLKPEALQAVDVVNLAFGAARLEINGTWHGTAAAFRNFRNKFIGSGEGATAYGWGTYLAERTGIAKGYWSQDVERKTKQRRLKRDAETLARVNKWAEEELGQDNDASSMNEARKRAAELGQELPDWAYEGGRPEGSLMRVDVAIDNERMYDYDKPVIKQSNYVADKLMKLLDPVSDEIVERTNKDVEELTGKDLIGSGERDLGVLSRLIMDDAISLPMGQDAQFDEAVRQGKFHEAASHYLRANGLDGIKFFDAKSRGTATRAISYDGRNYNRDELREQVRKFRNTDNDKAMAFMVLSDVLRNGLAETRGALEKKVAEYEQMFVNTDKESAARYGVKFDEAKARADAKERAKSTVYQAKQLEWLNANEGKFSVVENPRTRNLVIFDDKNIFRVGAETAADRQRMKFGKEAQAVNRNINKLPEQLRQPVKNSVGVLNDLAGGYLDYALFTSDLVKRAEKAGMTAARKWADVLAKSKSAANASERVIEKIADMYATIEDQYKGSGPGTVNDFLFESTRQGKWGYGKYRDAQMGDAFDALGPKAQEFVKAVFAHGEKMLAEKKKVVLDATNSEYDSAIKAAQLLGTADEVKRLQAEKASNLKRFQTLFRIREGLPYAPIKRSGNWVLVGRSDEYMQALEANDTAKLRELEKSPEHYQVSFVDTKWQARNLEAELQQASPGLNITFTKRAEAMDSYTSEGLLPALTKLRARVSQDDKAPARMLSAISQLYLEALAEDSARKSEMRRRGISGQVDMLSSFTTQGRADANFMASVKYNPEIQDAMQQMWLQSKKGDASRRSEIFAELSKRYIESLDYSVNPWVDKLTSLSSKYFLATSPGYYIQNLTQPFMMSVPAMAGKHDYAKVGQELWKAYSELGPLFKNTKLFDQQFDFTQVPMDVRAAVDELVKRGKIDIGLATEINEYKVDADNKLSQSANRINKGLRLAVQKAEAVNRLSTAMAAYRLELARTKDRAAAIEYADRILTETHGDYTAFNAPRIFNTNFGKIALQFRKFQLVQIAFYAKLIREAFTNPAERNAALRTLGYSLAHTGVFAGALGLPGYAAVAALAGFFFGDEDEPFDLTEEMRKALGPDWSQLVMRGAPTLVGVDLSGKIGAGNMLSIAPFADIDLTTQAGVYQAIGTVAGGAAGGMTARMLDGLGLMANGDWYRGLEQTMPKGISDMMKAGRITGEGLTRRNGDVILPASDVSAVGQVFAAMGLPDAKVAETYQAMQYSKDLEKNFTERATKIKNQYAKASRDRDTEAMAEARTAWSKLQDARKRNDMKPQPMSSLLKAPQEQLKREKKIATQID